MRAFYGCEVTYPFVAQQVLDAVDSVRASLPNKYCDPKIAADLYHETLDEYLVSDDVGLNVMATEHHAGINSLIGSNPTFVGIIARQTRKARILSLGTLISLRSDPVRIAEEYAMIDVMSGGRLVPGLVVGLSYDSSINNGVPPMQVRQRFDENLELVLRAWTEQTPFAWNGKFAQYPMVNMWPRPLQSHLATWITGIGNPNTMKMCLERGFGFTYLSWFGAKLTGKRIFDRFWEIADQVGVPRNPYRLGFLQTVAVAETDEQAEQDYAAHLEYGFRKGLGSIPTEKLGLPGGIDIRGVQALLKDPGDFGLYYQMKTATYRDLVDAGVVIAGSPATVREQLRTFCREYGIGNLHAMLSFGSLPRHLVMKNIQLFSEEVLPHLRDLWTDTGHQHHWWPERLGGSPATRQLPANSGLAVAR